MKFQILFLVLLLNYFTAEAFAQEKSNGLSALIYSAPEKSEIKTFNSVAFGFSIDFVGNPVTSEKQLSNGQVTKFSTKRKGSNAVVKIYSIATKEGENLDAENVYKIFKTDYLKIPNAELLRETTFNLGILNGKEYSITAGIEFYKFRIFVTEKRVYEVYISATNWKILNESRLDAKKEFEKETERFFNSFKLTIK